MSDDANANPSRPARTRALSEVLDLLIPRSADGRLPAAGELGLVAQIEATARDTPELADLIEQGLSRLDELARQRGAERFVAAGRALQLELLGELATSAPGFLPSLVFHTYVGYYQHPRVVEALGLEPRPPHPQGYALEPGDLGLLEAVRARGEIYRKP